MIATSQSAHEKDLNLLRADMLQVMHANNLRADQRQAEYLTKLGQLHSQAVNSVLPSAVHSVLPSAARSVLPSTVTPVPPLNANPNQPLTAELLRKHSEQLGSPPLPAPSSYHGRAHHARHLRKEMQEMRESHKRLDNKSSPTKPAPTADQRHFEPPAMPSSIPDNNCYPHLTLLLANAHPAAQPTYAAHAHSHDRLVNKRSTFSRNYQTKIPNSDQKYVIVFSS